MKLVTGFRDFVLRGNVIDLAVAVVIGTAFTAVVTSVVQGLINPLIAAIGGGPNLAGTWVVPLRTITVDGQAQEVGLQFGTVVGAVLNFLIVAAVVYFLVVTPLNRLLALRKENQAPEPAAPSEDVRLLTEIRDLLAQQRGGSPAGDRGPRTGA
ncbi:large conductance mechanosensitive channel protein MscL [Paenibacillus sp. TRM 82003]|uniref:large conductance mechanosensitive channel protein MscL n=1 Tax=Kineococcus sp. TRM81007 TaxID=2925831 RepID=UPI001F5AE23D|nr:large conductance mechanosensitive channel protein MscL [Kineococcus sp. TRM81007]MCI2237592.1 large conductance mechanosensitive channel protein MscL [Kineococcus sp. TRM81007]MCI3921836.1 large conductance mechanosensitive channel protein MscL [Paenibacillus sp. TRM 82003]